MNRDRETYWPAPTLRPREHWLLRLWEILTAAPDPPAYLVVPEWPLLDPRRS